MSGIRDVVIMLSDDKNKARLAIVDRHPGRDEPLAFHDFDAPALSNLIVILGQMREKMADRIPDQMDPGKVSLPGSQINPAVYVGSEGPYAKRFIMAVRHPGYGWLGFGWNEANGRNVAGHLMAQVLRIAELPSGLIHPGTGRKL